MELTAVQIEIQAAVKTLGLTPECFRQIADTEGEQVYRAALNRFVTAENHHDVIFGSGDPVTRSITAYLNANRNAK